MKSRFGPTKACAEFMLVAKMHSSFRHGSRPRFKPTDSICTCCIIFRIGCSTRTITQPVVRHKSCQETAIVNARSVRSGIVLALSSATHAFEGRCSVCAINNQKARMKAKVNNLSIMRFHDRFGARVSARNSALSNPAQQSQNRQRESAKP